jgi:hypothetical protein
MEIQVFFLLQNGQNSNETVVSFAFFRIPQINFFDEIWETYFRPKKPFGSGSNKNNAINSLFPA